MNFLEYDSVPNKLSLPMDFSIQNHKSGKIEVDGYLAVKVTYVSPLIKKAIVPIFKDGIEIAILNNGNIEMENVSSLSWIDTLCYLETIEKKHFGIPHMTINTFLVFPSDRFSDIGTLFFGSINWSGFIIDGDPLNNFVSISDQTITGLIYKKNFSFETDEQNFLFTNIIKHSTASNVYLSKYHLIEFYFDKQIVEKIKSLGTNLKGIGKVIKDLSGKEIEKLTKLITSRINDISMLEKLMEKLCIPPDWIDNFIDLAFSFDKTTNPLADKDNEFTDLILSGTFSETNWRRFHLPLNYKDNLLKFVCYIVYRLRCSVAHRRLGEYLISVDDEKMYLDFGIPLIDYILEALFS